MRQRPLTDREQRVLKLCKRFEEAVDTKQVTVSIHTNKEIVAAIQKLENHFNKFKVLSYQFDPKKEQYRVTWTLHEYQRYLLWTLETVGMTLMIDGSIKTQDGLTITNEYLQ
jgi:hypothetical protein